jgi:hypothetical protein
MRSSTGRTAKLGGAIAFIGALAAAAAAGSGLADGAVPAGPLAKVLAHFQAAASPDQAGQVRRAVLSSPSLEAQLERLTATGRLKRIALAAPGDPRLAGSPFAARAVGDEIVMTADFLQAQAPRRLLDVVRPEDVLPDNLVFVLGHLAEHLEHPLRLEGPRPSREAYIALRLADEAKAYAAGWNDMVESSVGADASVPRVGSALLNFRYRGVFIKAMRSEKDLLSPSGKIDPTPANLAAIAQALGTTPMADFE